MLAVHSCIRHPSYSNNATFNGFSTGRIYDASDAGRLVKTVVKRACLVDFVLVNLEFLTNWVLAIALSTRLDCFLVSLFGFEICRFSYICVERHTKKVFQSMFIFFFSLQNNTSNISFPVFSSHYILVGKTPIMHRVPYSIALCTLYNDIFNYDNIT